MIGSVSVSDVNHVLPQTLALLKLHGIKHTADSLANARSTIEWPGVFITEYTNPTRCVLFDTVRDANPFFHYLESMWILAGRRDVKFLAWVLPAMANYSDDSRVFHGAYGYRLRKYMGVDQVEQAIDILAKSPASRQVVMQIWDSEIDLGATSKDIPCNDLVMLKVRDGKLNITVNNRSNDAIWGAYGANVVQFSMLQMYMAARLGVGVGRYMQISDSMHVYEDTPYWQRFLAEDNLAYMSPYTGIPDVNMFDKLHIELFDEELIRFFAEADIAITYQNYLRPSDFKNGVVSDAVCIFNSIRSHKDRRHADAGYWADRITANDWHLACTAWLNRRVQGALL